MIRRKRVRSSSTSSSAPRGNVPHDPGKEPLAFVPPPFGNRQFQRKHGAVLAAPLHFAPGPNNSRDCRPKVIADIFIVMDTMVRSHQHGYVLTYDLGFRVTEGFCSGGIGGLDNASLVDHDHGI